MTQHKLCINCRNHFVEYGHNGAFLGHRCTGWTEGGVSVVTGESTVPMTPVSCDDMRSRGPCGRGGAMFVREMPAALADRTLPELWGTVRDWWWHLWTGDANEESTRRRIEEEARRFGGTVHWDRGVHRDRDL